MDALDDVLNAVRLMIRRNEGAVKMYLPISLVFQHQVYRTIQSRTKVDQSIYNLRKRGKILIIRMNGSLHDAKGIVLLDSYQQLLKRVLIDSCIATHFKDCFKVLVQHLPKMGTFSDKIYYSYFEELFGMKASDNRKRKRNEQVHDVLWYIYINLLKVYLYCSVCMKMGILLPRRDLDDQEEVYQLSIPKLGKLIKAMVKARSEIMMTIKVRCLYDNRYRMHIYEYSDDHFRKLVNATSNL